MTAPVRMSDKIQVVGMKRAGEAKNIICSIEKMDDIEKVDREYDNREDRMAKKDSLLRSN